MQSNFKKPKGKDADPQEIAIAVLGWLASEPDMFGRFLAITGMEPSQLRNAVNEPSFLGGLLDFLMNHEPSLMAFCEASGTAPEAVMAASAHFSGASLGSGEY
ncbi:DUF3572 domain-containing protein [Rhizobium sp. HT1-10]|uniref:DUF3572 domain-containing protein n=1 Tax=Rhizobium sp. HT1-10 TaxID=3111638 RepID=UPI003C2167CA